MLNIEQKMARDHALAVGMVTSDGKMWFNERTGILFMIKLNTYLNISDISFWKNKESDVTFRWKDVNRKVIDINLEQAKIYAAEILTKLDEVYLNEV